MKAIFFGATKFSEDILTHLLNNNIDVGALFTIPQEFGISYSDTKVKNYNYSELEIVATKNNIPCYYIDSSQEGKITSDYSEIIESINPDVILIMGWYYMVPKKIRDLAKYGAWGIHASMLPDYAGGAPLVWAIINGEKETGITLFKLDDGIDDGDIIEQEKIVIGENDSIKEVYEKVTIASKNILLKVLQNISTIKFTPQDKSKIKIYPQRKPDDGEIDLTKTAKDLYNFIRAQSSPYPGAFIRTVDGKKLIIEKARIE
ncbi:MAG: formyltransferase family protein [Bacteroidota bacterium]|nr:formyltransferase family protein [Bacteroidota bacterium]MDP3146170.1 formyltransferase family protein [Bacteroidota bacterium]MDP3556677.1 formyltransferase family protein [Bacteroidota bacterium]